MRISVCIQYLYICVYKSVFYTCGIQFAYNHMSSIIKCTIAVGTSYFYIWNGANGCVQWTMNNYFEYFEICLSISMDFCRINKCLIIVMGMAHRINSYGLHWNEKHKKCSRLFLKFSSVWFIWFYLITTRNNCIAITIHKSGQMLLVSRVPNLFHMKPSDLNWIFNVEVATSREFINNSKIRIFQLCPNGAC